DVAVAGENHRGSAVIGDHADEIAEVGIAELGKTFHRKPAWVGLRGTESEFWADQLIGHDLKVTKGVGAGGEFQRAAICGWEGHRKITAVIAIPKHPGHAGLLEVIGATPAL